LEGNQAVSAGRAAAKQTDESGGQVIR